MRRLAAIKRVEEATRSLQAALSEALRESKVVLNVVSQLGKSPPLLLADGEGRLARRMTVVLSQISPDHRARFGQIEYGATFLLPTDDWADGEKIYIEELVGPKVKAHGSN